MLYVESVKLFTSIYTEHSYYLTHCQFSIISAIFVHSFLGTLLHRLLLIAFLYTSLPHSAHQTEFSPNILRIAYVILIYELIKWIYKFFLLKNRRPLPIPQPNSTFFSSEYSKAERISFVNVKIESMWCADIGNKAHVIVSSASAIVLQFSKYVKNH